MKMNSVALIALLSAHTAVFAADAQTDAKLREALAISLQSLPMQIDKRTTLTSVTLMPGHVLTYRYAIDMAGMLDDAAAKGNLTRAQLMAGLEQNGGSGWKNQWASLYIFPYIQKSGCSQPFTQSILKLGYSLNHSMTDADGTYLFERAVTRQDCNI